ncbi:MAG: hypothetical protein HQL69_09360 [Magnetococcales bacterium]|nr:hypothetical protein [Magnetococcales bacterium]
MVEKEEEKPVNFAKREFLFFNLFVLLLISWDFVKGAAVLFIFCLFVDVGEYPSRVVVYIFFTSMIASFIISVLFMTIAGGNIFSLPLVLLLKIFRWDLKKLLSIRASNQIALVLFLVFSVCLIWFMHDYNGPDDFTDFIGGIIYVLAVLLLHMKKYKMDSALKSDFIDWQHQE